MLLRRLQTQASGSIHELARTSVVDPMPMARSGLLLCRRVASWVSSLPSHRFVAAIVAGGWAICPSHAHSEAGCNLSHIHSTNIPTRCLVGRACRAWQQPRKVQTMIAGDNKGCVGHVVVDVWWCCGVWGMRLRNCVMFVLLCFVQGGWYRPGVIIRVV